jgi:hypothetical protein
MSAKDAGAGEEIYAPVMQSRHTRKHSRLHTQASRANELHSITFCRCRLNNNSVCCGRLRIVFGVKVIYLFLR